LGLSAMGFDVLRSEVAKKAGPAGFRGFDASDDAEYGFTVEVMDQAREGGAVTIAALTSPLQSAAATAASP